MIADAMPTNDAPNETEPTGYTIDELASAARVPSRTIRFYQSRGALMPPEIRGRVAHYGEGHVERLKLIAQLQDRGLRIDAIGDLLASIDRGEMDLAEWLGVEQQVQAPWANDQPRTLNEEELYELAGTRRPGLIADLVRTRLAERHRDVYLVRSPALLAIAMKLEAAGIDLETASLASALVRKHLTRLSEDVVALFMKRAGDGEIAARDLGNVFESLRPLGTEAVRVIFGRAMERELRKLYESGKMAKLPGRARKARRRER
jgi:DNA-binding transcriptional MerR regulator